MTILPLTLMFGVSPLTVLHIYPMVLRRIDIKKVKVYPRDYLDSGILIIKPKNLIESYYKKMLHMKPLILTAAVICIGFWTIHVLSVMAFIQYGNEVLNSENYHYIIPIAHAVLSLLAVATGFVLTVIFLKVRISKYKQQQQQQQQEGSNDVLYDQSLLIPAAAISVNFIYIGCFFLPYMLLAFVHDPLLTTFTYLTLVLFIVCIYLLCLGICHLYKFYNNKKDTYNKDIKRAKFLNSILYSCMVWALAFSLMMFLVIVTYIISLGSFNDFKDLKYLISSLPLVVVLFLLRPAITLVSNKNEEASNDNDDRRMEEGQRAENNDDQTHPDTTENSDSDSQTQVLTDNN